MFEKKNSSERNLKSLNQIIADNCRISHKLLIMLDEKKQNMAKQYRLAKKHNGPISLSHLIPGLKLNQVTT